MKRNIFCFLFILLLTIQFIQLGAADILLEYEKEIIVTPSSLQNLSILVTNLEDSVMNLYFNCSSALVVEYPAKFSINPDEKREIYIVIRSSENAGVFPINFTVGGKNGSINIRVSDSPKTLLRILDSYNESLSAFNKGTEKQNISEIQEAAVVLDRAYELYEKGSYYEVNSLVDELQNKIANASRKIGEIRLSQATAIGQGLVIAKITPFDLSYIDFLISSKILYIMALIIAVIIFIKCVIPRLRKREKISFTQGIFSIKGELEPKETNLKSGKGRNREIGKKNLDVNTLKNTHVSMGI